MKNLMKSAVFSAAVACAVCIFVAPAYSDSASCVMFGTESAQDDDGDCVVDMVEDFLPAGTEIDNCPGVRNGYCDTNPAYCNFDGSYVNGDPDTLSEKARTAGNQADWNRNGVGDACDDADGDGVLDYIDNCKSIANPDQDPGYCNDADGDGFEDAIDNCIDHYNNLQIDSDEDGHGDWCDNCPIYYNPDQADDNGDGYGNECPPSDFDLVPGESTPEVPEIPFQFGPDKTQGNGGCSFTGGSANPSAMLAVFMMIAAAAFIKKIRS